MNVSEGGREICQEPLVSASSSVVLGKGTKETVCILLHRASAQVRHLIIVDWLYLN